MTGMTDVPDKGMGRGSMGTWLSAILSTALGKSAGAALAAVVAVGAAAVATDSLPTFDDGSTDVVVAQVEDNGDVEPQVENGDNGVEPQDENGDEPHGQTVSAFANEGAEELDLEGCEKGQAISLVARGEDPEAIEAGLDANPDALECLTGAERAEHVQENHPGKVEAAGGSRPDHAGQGLERAEQARANAGPPDRNGNGDLRDTTRPRRG
jgi:hypothetical protein